MPEDLKKLNLNTDTMIKNVKLAELNTKIAIAFFNAKTLKDDLTEQKCLCCNKNNQKKVWWKIYRYVIHDIKRYQRRNVSRYSSISKSW